MFTDIVQIMLALVLIFGSGEAMALGLFSKRKRVGRCLSYGLSMIFWAACYSWKWMGW